MKQVDFGALLEAIPDAVIVADMDARITYVNAAVERLLGWRVEELLGQSLHLIQPERLHAPHDAAFERYAATGVPSLFGTALRVPARLSDGTERDIELNLSEIVDHSGQRLVLGVLRDLREREELERNLIVLEQERLARTAADRASGQFETLARVSGRLGDSLNAEVTAQAVADSVVPDFADWCVVDLKTEGDVLQRVGSAHRDAAKIEAIRELRRRYPPDQSTDPPHAIYRALDGARVWESVDDEDLVQRAVDADHLALLRALGIGSHVVVPLLARGRAMGAISLVRGPERPPFDAEELATAEDIGRRTALAVDNARLYRAAQQAIELRDRFLAVASHELRNPLSVVKGHWELLARRLEREPPAPEEHRRQVDNSLRRLGRGIEQLQRLVEELLDVDRLRDGSVELRRAELDLAVLVRDTVAGAYDAETRRRIRLELPEAPVTGMWDGARLAQVISNLMNNALRYSAPDGRVELSLSNIGGEVLIRVTDAGIGIAADQLDAIFEPFSRAPNAMAEHHHGLGLGLAVSREIVVRLGGRLWAESAGEGRGSTFFLELPRASQESSVRDRGASAHDGPDHQGGTDGPDDRQADEHRQVGDG